MATLPSPLTRLAAVLRRALLLAWLTLLWAVRSAMILVNAGFARLDSVGHDTDTVSRTSSPASAASAPDAAPPLALVVFSHVPWHAIRQRNQQTMERLARHRPVLYLAPLPIHAAARASSVLMPCLWQDPASGVHAVTPLLLPGESRWPVVRAINATLLRLELRGHLRALGIRHFLTWTYFPAWTYLIGRMGEWGERGVVYDMQDNYAQFPWAARDVAEREREVLDRAGLVFTGTRALWRRYSDRHGNIHCVPCGVEFEHFAQVWIEPRPPVGTGQDLHLTPAELAARRPAERQVLPEAVRNHRGPVLGHYGYVDARKIDLELLDYLAESRPDWLIWMIGPVHREHFRPPRARNVLYTGPMAYADLPEALRRFDVALLPFACNELTLDTHPTKTLEYLASGRPTVSTAIPDIVEYYGDAIAIAASHEEFLAHCTRAVAHPETFATPRGIEIARAMTWDRVTAGMEERLESLTAEKHA